ncbi:hypothetical protein QBC41DRAFT_297552 [Cercophora samala]|uniref:Uncharacterized protein n=1 Tax=Cercophora samala TaxID=330535 RepID=A0AA39ZNP0_9PEZI|nr:hypothetical protein QBC41DRAFT_297552 [Cercophora samala]
MHDGSCPKCGAASEGKSCGSCGAQTFSPSRRSPITAISSSSSASTSSQRHQFPLTQLDDQPPLSALYDLARSPHGRQQSRKRHLQQKGFTSFVGRQAGSYVYLANVRKSISEENKNKTKTKNRNNSRRRSSGGGGGDSRRRGED